MALLGARLAERRGFDLKDCAWRGMAFHDIA